MHLGQITAGCQAVKGAHGVELEARGSVRYQEKLWQVLVDDPAGVVEKINKSPAEGEIEVNDLGETTWLYEDK
jgi:hypothetical protein